jgi:hypothetical protein
MAKFHLFENTALPDHGGHITDEGNTWIGNKKPWH